MDLAAVLDMLDRTFVDRIDATLTFETASDSVRTRLSIEDRFFSLDLRASSGDAILVTPGRVVASDGATTFDVLNADTSASLTAWKSQPPTSYSPIAAGLNQLTTTNNSVNQIISRLAGFSGSLGIGLFPTLCWYSARYPGLTFGDLQLFDVVGKICLKDVILATDHVAFSVQLAASSSKGQLKTVIHKDSGGTTIGEDSVLLTDITLSLNVSADLNLVDETADVVIERANFDVNGLTGTFGDPNDPWSLQASSGIRLEAENLRQKVKLNPAEQLSTQGNLRFFLPACSVSKTRWTTGASTVVDFLSPISIVGLRLDLNVSTNSGHPSQTTGEVQLDRLDLRATYTDGNLVIQGLNGNLQVDALSFGPESVEIRFDLLGAQIAEVNLPTGKTTLERLIVQGNIVDIAGRFSAIGDRTVLLMDKLHLTSAQGTWKLVLQAINSASTTDPLSIQFAVNGGNAIDMFAQQFLSITAPTNRTTAERVEVRIRDASTSAPVARFILSEHHELTPSSFTLLRAIPVPNAVLAKFEGEMLNVRYSTSEELLSEVQRRLTATEFSTHGANIDAAAVHHQTYLANANVTIAGILFKGCLLEKTLANSQLNGELSWSILEFGFDEIVGLELPNFQQLGRVHPVNASDKYPVADGRFLLPDGIFLPGVAAFSQQFDSATISIGGSATIDVATGANRLRINLLPQLPILEGVVAQASIPNSTLNTGANSLALADARVDIYRKTFSPTISHAQKTLLLDTVLRFGIVSGPISFRLIPGSRHDISKDDLSIANIIRLFTNLLNDAGIAIPAGAFTLLERAFDNPAMNVAGDILGDLSSAIADITGFGVDDWGIRIETHDVQAVLMPFPDSNSSRVSVAVRVRLPSLGAYVKVKWREPALAIPPYSDHDRTFDSGTHDVLPFSIDLVLSISYRINSVSHSVEITDVSVRVLPHTGTIADGIISEASRLFDAITGVTAIREKVVQELSGLFRIALPDNLNLDLARIDFDAAGKMTISVEARQLDWNSL